jgi:DNA polymerase-4
VKKELGITVSVGVSFNKVFAKLGSDYKKPDATTVITPSNYKEIVHPLPWASSLCGQISPENTGVHGIRTIGQLRRRTKSTWPPAGKLGELTMTMPRHRPEHGKTCPAGAKPKSIGNGITIPTGFCAALRRAARRFVPLRYGCRPPSLSGAYPCATLCVTIKYPGF